MPSGERWERHAEAHLKSAGLETVQRNFRCRLGEIDLVMEDGDCLVFVEVRYRRSTAHGTGAESVSAAKRGRLIRAARFYLARHPQAARRPCRFDVVSITGGPRPDFDWISDAFDAS